MSGIIFTSRHTSIYIRLMCLFARISFIESSGILVDPVAHRGIVASSRALDSRHRIRGDSAGILATLTRWVCDMRNKGNSVKCEGMD